MQAFIQNNKGMGCQLIALAYGPDGDDFYKRTLYCLDIAGASTAAKAIWASLCSGTPLKTAGIGQNYRKFHGDKEAHYRTFTSQPLPKVAHYHSVVEPRIDASYYVITSLTGQSREIALYDILRLYTPHPVLPGWGKALFDLALSRQYNLVSALEVAGMEWAYRIASVGWDTLIDQAVKEGRIAVPEVNRG